MNHSIRRRGIGPKRDDRRQCISQIASALDAAASAESGTKASDVALERHYTVSEIAEAWHADYKTVRRMFEGQPGVLMWGPGERRFKRSHISLRIPESVLIRVHRMCRNPK